MQNLDSAASDIVIVGAGGCGLMAALVAAKKGAQVLLLEKTDKPGGGTAFSSKGIRAAGSRRQRELKIPDSPELYAQDILRRNNNESDVVLTRRLAETSCRVADFLADAAGIEFDLGEFPFGHSAQRSHSWKVDKRITDFLFEAVEREKNIQVRFSTAVLSLEQEASGAVTGVVTKDGVIAARKIILAPGGLGTKMLDLPGKQAYEIFDERIYQRQRNAPGPRNLASFLDEGILNRAETAEELAGKLAIDAGGLKQTIRDYNDSAASGGKDAYGRMLPEPFNAPFYGIKVTVALYHTQGGLKVNPNGQVLRADGSIIPNLYAGGGVAVGVSGKGLEGYLPGNGLLASLGLGMIAAEHALASLTE